MNNDQAQDLKEAGEQAGQTAEQQAAVAEQIQNKPKSRKLPNKMPKQPNNLKIRATVENAMGFGKS